MEGEYCDLSNVVRVCKKYGAFVYLDEAHSIGAMGPTGRGCSEYCGVDTADIDIMMGTFTKSYGGMGGYIAASKDVISHPRRRCAGSTYHNSLSPVVCQQVITSFKVRQAVATKAESLTGTMASGLTFLFHQIYRSSWEKMERILESRRFKHFATTPITSECDCKIWD